MEIKGVDHIGIAFRDLGPARDALEKIFGLQVETEFAFAEYESKLAMIPVGGTQLELLQGTSRTPLVGDWLSANGEGLFHICLEVDDIRAALAELKAKRVKLIDEEPRESRGHLIAFIDPSATAN